jgi:hypothetical protein
MNMAKTRQLLNMASIETAVRRRVCHHNRKKHAIAGGTKCLVIKDAASGGSKNYCPECAEAIFASIEDDLSILRTKLSS